MAVFTAVSRQELTGWLRAYPVGELIDFRGIAAGIENSNFFVTTTGGRFVLTLFERLPAARLPFYLTLMRHLAARGVPCPDPVADDGGALASTLAGKPAALVTRLPGHSVDRPGTRHCARVGALLARMHRAALDYPARQPNLRGLDWWLEVGPGVVAQLPAAQAGMLRDELEAQRAFGRGALARALPAGAVHADLFRDNVLFDGDHVGGVIDFYFAGCDHWLFDLAVACNDWCVDAAGAFDASRLAALLDAYAAGRAFTDAEREAWPTVLRAAALRFWLSRLVDRLRPRPARIVSPKDPAEFERILRLRRGPVPALPAAKMRACALGGH